MLRTNLTPPGLLAVFLRRDGPEAHRVSGEIVVGHHALDPGIVFTDERDIVQHRLLFAVGFAPEIGRPGHALGVCRILNRVGAVVRE